MASGIQRISGQYGATAAIGFGARPALQMIPDRVTFSGRKKDVKEAPQPGHVHIGGIPFLGFLRLLPTLPSVIKNLGGYPLDKDQLKSYQKQWGADIQDRLKTIASTENYGLDIPRVASTMAGFGISRWRGLPPGVKWQEKEKKSARINGVLAEIVLHILNELPPAGNMEEGVAQLDQLLQQVSKGCRKQGEKLTGAKTKKKASVSSANRTDLEPGGYINKGGYSVAAVRGKNWSTVQTKHLSRIAPNGAIQVLLIPGAKDLADIIRHDGMARAFLDAHPVLSDRHWGFYPYKGKLDADDTIALLEDEAGIKTHVHEGSQWSDVHTLVREMPFDIERQIADGRLNVIFDKPGADGRRVGEAA